MIGKRFNKLVVIEFADRIGVRGYVKRWICQCDCGNKTIVRGHNLTSGNTKSCGCEAGKSRQTKWNLRHGHASNGYETKVYVAWMNMRKRCYKTNHAGYERYGGRGITVCERWMTFENFYEDMGEPPETTGYSLDRINNNGNYEPGNCKWSTASEQQSNRRYKYEK